MIFSYKDLVILLSNFDLDQIHFQSENSIRFDLLNNSKKNEGSKCHLSNVEISLDVKA